MLMQLTDQFLYVSIGFLKVCYYAFSNITFHEMCDVAVNVNNLQSCEYENA